MLDSRMSGADLKATREYLGLSQDALGEILRVNPTTIDKWERGLKPIPYRIPDEISDIERYTEAAATSLSIRIKATGAPAIVFRTDTQFREAMPRRGQYTARWWRHVAARARHMTPGIEIVYPQET